MYNEPPCAAPEAEHLMRRALTKHFKKAAWGNNYVHTDKSRDTNLFGISQTIKKVRDRAKSRLPARLYHAEESA